MITALTASPVWTGTHHRIQWPCYCGYAWPTKDELHAHIMEQHPTWTIQPTADDSPDANDHDAVQRWAEAMLSDAMRYPPNTTDKGNQART